ncbi:response regulator [Bacillus sp. JCM 19046]|nr:response regulator [Bacillus sp. JCM 19045]GAF20316.1 response regulator [Bacillus sp. JCM 19046]
MELQIALVGEGPHVEHVSRLIKRAERSSVYRDVNQYHSIEALAETSEIPHVIAIEESLFFEALSFLQQKLKQVSLEKGRKLIITDIASDWEESKLYEWEKEFPFAQPTLQIPVPGGMREEVIEDIVYFENNNRKVFIQTKAERYQTSLRLKEVMEKTANFAFQSPYVSYVVHLAYVQEIKQSDLIMKNGEVLPLSQKKASEFRKVFHTYLSSLH